ncbi:hypothetical protein L873DRAFT_1825281 [Choiromyces venosus 120613-1]|uniref:Uncharacterized protein n=1 Tax=Choiromyces venosus 120613-1 TaxID=1336337 RepID=A0A3N4K775_9PEZI|nr:hypothetical protein L873DRAFT_1825281 [Choiromyces venosus 120613-1]
MSGEIAHRAKTFLDTNGRHYVESPLPALASSIAILCRLPDSKRFYNSRIFPRPWTVLLYSSLFAASGWMTYDNAPIDGAGTTAAWSAIYCIMNGSPRTLGRLLRVGRIAPIGIAGFAAVNTVTHGYYYLTTPRSKEDVEEVKILKGK